MDKVILHASCVSFQRSGILIVGASGSGKSALSLQLMAYGAELVADDRTRLELADGAILATAPATISGLVEARGVGLLRVAPCSSTRVRLVVDLGHTETKRLPDAHWHRLFDVDLPCLHKVDAPHFPAAILQYVRGTSEDAP